MKNSPCFAQGALAYAPSLVPICVTTAAIGSPLAQWLLQNGARVIYHSPVAWPTISGVQCSKAQKLGGFNHYL